MQPGHVTVLVVDDEQSVREFVERVLEGAGYQTVTADGGPSALALVNRRGMPDLLLADLRMPEMQGYELAAKLRQTNPHLKVLYLTGYSNQLFEHKQMLWEDEAFLDKPCSVRGLTEAVSMILCGHVAPDGPRPDAQMS